MPRFYVASLLALAATFYAACAVCTSGARAEDTASPGLRVEKNIVYGHGLDKEGGAPVDLVMNAYVPEGDAKDRPCILFIHGNPGSKPYPGERTEGFAASRDYFAQRGFVCFVLSYHFFGLDEVKTAVRWIRANATRYGIDEKKIAAVGRSLGGSHAVSLDVTEEAEAPPPLPNDPANNSGESARVVAAVCLAGGIFTQEALDHSDGPLLFIQGTADTVNWPGQREVIGGLCQKAGVPFASYMLEGVGHGLDLATLKADGRTLNELIEQFLRIHVLHDPKAAMATLAVSTQGDGQVSLDPPYGMYTKGTKVEITAVSASNASFSQWTGDVKGDTNPLSLELGENKQVTAVFVLK